MIFTHTSPRPATGALTETVERIPLQAHRSVKRKAGRLHILTVLCLFVACFSASWFAYQCFLVPQQGSFAPDWHGAQWVQAADSTAPTSFFRYVSDLKTVPDNAFVTITANQVFQVYVNGASVGTNTQDMGSFPRAYMYEVTPLMTPGVNVIAVRVSNLDDQVPMLRATFGVVDGGMNFYAGTNRDNGWQATAQPTLVFPSYSTDANATQLWTSPTFDASSWRLVQQAVTPSMVPALLINPLLYEQPVSTQWSSAGVGRDSYFVRQFSIPGNITHAWLRLAATGTTTVFLNGMPLINWNYQPSVIQRNIRNSVKLRDILVLGVYDISPYLHGGNNTLALHVALPTLKGASSGSANASAQLLLDMLVSDGQGHMAWFSASNGWHTSQQPVANWEAGSTATLSWHESVTVGPPTGFGMLYASQSQELSVGQQGAQVVPFTLTCEVLALSIIAVLGLWLLMSLIVMRRYYCSARASLEAMSLAFLPALGGEVLLFVLAREPQIPQPFPYTLFWGAVLLTLVAVGYLLLWLHIYTSQKMKRSANHLAMWAKASTPLSVLRVETLLRDTKQRLPVNAVRFLHWLRAHWPILVIVLLAAPLVWYGLGYEPYWQDELVSYMVAKSIMLNGLPLLPSGFVYPKGELYSYILALSMKIFGDQNGAARIVSAIEYTITIPLCYRVGCYFFDRRVALLAAATLAFSSHEIFWGHQVRMYEQAQMLTLLSVFLFYKAIQERKRIHLIYAAIGVLLATYLSHEETFIILPAMVICVLLASWQARDPKHRLPEILYQKHWWYAALIGICVIGAQLLIVQMTHPPVLGVDASARPQIQLTSDNLSYYFTLLFFPTTNDPSFSNTFASGVATTIGLNSILAVLGCFMALRSGDARSKYCALFLLIAFSTLLFIFTMEADRYFYPLLPFYNLMGAYALVTMLQAIWRFACSHAPSWGARKQSADQKPVAGPNSISLNREGAVSGEGAVAQKSHVYGSPFLRILIGLNAAFLCISVVVMLMLPLSSYNLLVSRVAGLPSYRRYGDYQDLQQYMQQHLQKGDIVISIIPDTVVLHYIGRSDYFFSVNHALFLFEKNGHIVDTYTGQIALLRESDLQAVLAKHGRIWIISGNNYYQSNVLKRFIIPPDFHIVYEGTGSIVYLRGG